MKIYSSTNTKPELIQLDLDCELVEAVAGKMYVLKNDVTVSENIRLLGHWAWDHVEIFKALNQNRGTFIDIGSYLGHHSVAILNWLAGSGKVIAVEGQPQMAELCGLNLDLQRFANWEVVESMADSNKNVYQIPRENFAEKNNFGSLSLISPQKEFGNEFFQVSSARLDNLLEGENNIQVMKFDVQYAELFALQGSSRILREQKPSLFVEIAPHYMLMKGGYDYRSIYNYLTGFGYRLFDVLGKPIEFGRSANPTLYSSDLEWDIIAVHESKLDVLRIIPWVA